jgi:hydroxypyruvate reductase
VSGEARDLLRRLFAAAIDAARPELCLPPHLPPPPKGRTIVVGAGKAAAAMAAALEAHWSAPLEGLVVTRYGHGTATRRIEVVEARHPVPDSAGQAAAARILASVRGLTADDLVIALISGGGSALMALPAGEVSLADKQAVNRALLGCGADIGEMNCVRRHLSAIKGGRLAQAAFPARVVSLMISDVPGDDPAVIASGPTAADPTTLADARAVLAKYAIAPPPAVAAHLNDPASETPKPGDPRLSRVTNKLIATPQQSLQAAAELARASGYAALILGDALEGEAREVARVLAGMARACRRHGHPAPAPVALISGGETTVTVRGAGRGGRNVEFLLALALALQGEPGIHALAGDTDGVDGAEEVAGAIIGPDTLARAAAAGLDAKQMLAQNAAHPFFAALDDQVITGPTLTNVNDFRAILIAPG